MLLLSARTIALDFTKRQTLKAKIKLSNCDLLGFFLETITYIETLPNGKQHLVAYKSQGSLQNSQKFKVPIGYYFLLGDNRDCSKDSRYLNSVGYVQNLNLVGEAKIIFFSNDTNISSLLKFWNLNKSFRFDRLFKGL